MKKEKRKLKKISMSLQEIGIPHSCQRIKRTRKRTAQDPSLNKSVRRGQSRQRQRLRDHSVPNGPSFVGDEQPIPRPPPLVKAKRQRGAVVDDAKSGEDDGDGEGQRQRKTEYTQTTLNPIRDSSLSKAAASKGCAFPRLPASPRFPEFNFTKHTKRAPLPHRHVMDFTASRTKRRESVAQQIADQTFAIEHEDGEEEVDIHSAEERSRSSGRHQEKTLER